MKTCEGNSKTLSISARFFFFVMLIYSSFFINFLHLRFLITTLKKKFLKPPLEEWGLCPVLHGFILPHPQLAPHDRENFIISSLSLRAPRSPTPPRKTLLLVNLLTTITIFFIKTFLLVKIYLKL